MRTYLPTYVSLCSRALIKASGSLVNTPRTVQAHNSCVGNGKP